MLSKVAKIEMNFHSIQRYGILVTDFEKGFRPTFSN